jgi:hypothetical protein
MSSRPMRNLFVLRSFAPEIIAIHPGQSTATALRQSGFAERQTGLIRRHVLKHVRRAAFRTHNFFGVISNNGYRLKVPQFSSVRLFSCRAGLEYLARDCVSELPDNDLHAQRWRRVRHLLR